MSCSGFQVSEIARALEMDDSALLDYLSEKRLEIEQAIRADQEKLQKIAVAQEQILGNSGDLHYNISIKSVPEYRVLSLRRVPYTSILLFNYPKILYFPTWGTAKKWPGSRTFLSLQEMPSHFTFCPPFHTCSSKIPCNP